MQHTIKKDVLTIVQFTDFHWDSGENNQAKIRDVVATAYTNEKPDYVVITGDLIYSQWCSSKEKSMQEVIDLVDSFAVPWSAVLGNHDDDERDRHQELLALMRNAQHSLVDMGSEKIKGASNFRVVLEAKRFSLQCFFFDTGGYLLPYHPDHPKYDGVDDSQLKWMQENNDKSLRTFVFQHIPCQEYLYAHNEIKERIGENLEAPCVSHLQSGQFELCKKEGNVEAFFCGHDHNNTSEIKYQGINLIYGINSGTFQYQENPAPVGYRVIKVSKDKWKTYPQIIAQSIRHAESGIDM